MTDIVSIQYKTEFMFIVYIPKTSDDVGGKGKVVLGSNV
jgi:hypothetical protein